MELQFHLFAVVDVPTVGQGITVAVGGGGAEAGGSSFDDLFGEGDFGNGGFGVDDFDCYCGFVGYCTTVVGDGVGEAVRTAKVGVGGVGNRAVFGFCGQLNCTGIDRAVWVAIVVNDVDGYALVGFGFGAVLVGDGGNIVFFKDDDVVYDGRC